MHRRRKKSLTRTLQTLVGAGLIPLSLFGVGSIWLAVQTQRDELKRSTVEISRALASGIEAKLDAEVAALAALGRSPFLQEKDYAAFYTFAKAEANARPGWAGVILTDRAGHVIFKTTMPFNEADASIADPDSLALATTTGEVTIGALTAGRAGRLAFPVRVPLTVDGGVDHVLTAVVRPDWALDLLRKQDVPDDWVISVFDRNLRRVARSRDHDSTVGGLPSPQLQKLFRDESAQRAVGLSRNLEGQETFTGFARIEPHRWVVGVGAPTAITTTTLARGIGWHVLGIVLSALACVLFARRMALRIARDVHAARDSAVRLGEGHEVAPEPSDIAELDEMSRAIASASVRLAAANAALNDALNVARQAGRTKDEFLAVLGHELRNPLAPMLTALHLMDLKGSPSTLKERQILQRQVDHMRRLVDDLLDMSRIASGKLQLQRRTVNVSELVERAVESLPLAHERERIALRLPDTPLWTDGDAVRLMQVLTNLLGNALRYGNDRAIALDVSGDEEKIHLVVRDDGIGMSAETLAHVFEPFYQAPQMLERKSGGLGLGLAIVKTIVEAHGGQVAARSAGLGAGSSLEVTLPACGPPPPVAHGQPALPTLATARVLVVDDNVDALDTLVQVLGLAGHTVRPALSPEDALATAATFVPDVAILDIGLPGMSGYELAEQLRGVVPSAVGLIALTGYGQSADKARARQAGFDVHLVKPVDADTLLGEVHRLLDRAGRA